MSHGAQHLPGSPHSGSWSRQQSKLHTNLSEDEGSRIKKKSKIQAKMGDGEVAGEE